MTMDCSVCMIKKKDFSHCRASGIHRTPLTIKGTEMIFQEGTNKIS